MLAAISKTRFRTSPLKTMNTLLSTSPISRFSHCGALALGAILLASCAHAAPQNAPAKTGTTWGEMQQPSGAFPADVGMVNVKTQYGAKGDGKTDDTAAIQKAILENRDKFRTIYFPNGTYMVSKTLTIGQDKQDVQFTCFQGESRNGAVLKLRDNAPGFDVPGEQKFLFTMFDGGTTGDAFAMRIYDMTFEVGKNNPSATALQWMNNNEGTLSNVTIRSVDGKGFAGIDLSRPEPGPGLFRNVLVEGFDYGIYSRFVVFSMTLENITLRNQNIAGIYNLDQTLTIRHLKSENKVPAIQSGNPSSVIFLFDSELAGGSADQPAILNQMGKLMLRNVKQSGYGKLVKNVGIGAADLEGTSVDEWISHGPKAAYAAFPSPFKTLGLPVEETPLVPWDDPKDWVGVEDLSQPDDTKAIQAAFDKAAAEGKGTVYFPAGIKERDLAIGDTIHIHGNVRRFIGNNCVITLTNGMGQGESKPIFDIDVNSPVFVAERFTVIEWNNKNFSTFRHTKGKTVVLRDLVSHFAYGGGPGGSKVFVENVASAPFIFNPGQKAWLRTPNPEADQPMIRNTGADVVIFGIKTESSGGIIVQTKGKGRTEVLGGEQYPSWDPKNIRDRAEGKWRGMWDVEQGSQGSFSTSEYAWRGDFGYDAPLRETRNGKTEVLGRKEASFSNRGGGENYLLTTAYPGSAKAPPAPVANVTLASQNDNIGALLQWQHDGKNVEAFRIERAADTGDFAPLVVMGGNHRAFNDYDVKSGDKVRYRVTAFNTAGNAKPVDATVLNVTDPAKPGTGTGLRAAYFSNITLGGKPVLARVEPVNFDWKGKSPEGLGLEQNYSVSWRGFIQPLYSGYHEFETFTDDGVRLWLDGKLLINVWPNYAEKQRTSAWLEAGKKYPIRMDYVQTNGGSSAKLSWKSPGRDWEIVPASQLYPMEETAPLPMQITLLENKAPLQETGKPLVLTLRREGDLAQPETVNFTLGGSALPDENFVAPGGAATFGAGQAEAQITLKPIHDKAITGRRDLTLTLLPDEDIRLQNSVVSAVMDDVDAPPGTGLGTGLLGTYGTITHAVIKDEKGEDQMQITDIATKATRVDPTINFVWGGSPGFDLPNDDFKIVWKGFIEPRFSEEYTFHTFGDDGFRLKIDGTQLVDHWTAYSGQREATMKLEAWKKYPITIEMMDLGGGAGVKLEWESASQAREVVPSAQLYPAKP